MEETLHDRIQAAVRFAVAHLDTSIRGHFDEQAHEVAVAFHHILEVFSDVLTRILVG